MRPGLLAVIVFLAAGAALLLTAQAAVAGGASLEGGGDDRIQLVASVDAPGNIVRSGDVFPLRVRVVDHRGAIVAGATVAVTVEFGAVTPPTALTDANGLARFEYRATLESARETVLVFDVTFEDAFADQERFALDVIPVISQRPAIATAETVGAGVGVAILAVLASTEFGRVGLFNLVVFPLYSRLRKEEVLDHFVRGQIYGYIQSHPGAHYNSLKDALRVTNGTLAHHLRTLEMQGYVQADRDGIYKRFYPVSMRIPRHRGIRLSDLQLHILDVIREDGGSTQQEIASHLSVSQQTVSYNLRHLSREGLVRIENEGRAKRYFTAET